MRNSMIDNPSSKNSVSDFIIDRDYNTDVKVNRKLVSDNSNNKSINQNIK